MVPAAFNNACFVALTALGSGALIAVSVPLSVFFSWLTGLGDSLLAVATSSMAFIPLGKGSQQED